MQEKEEKRGGKIPSQRNLQAILDRDGLLDLFQSIYAADSNQRVTGLKIEDQENGDNTNMLLWNDKPLLIFKGGSAFDGKKNNIIAVLRNLMNNEDCNAATPWTNKSLDQRLEFHKRVYYPIRKKTSENVPEKEMK